MNLVFFKNVIKWRQSDRDRLVKEGKTDTPQRSWNRNERRLEHAKETKKMTLLPALRISGKCLEASESKGSRAAPSLSSDSASGTGLPHPTDRPPLLLLPPWTFFFLSSTNYHCNKNVTLDVMAYKSVTCSAQLSKIP